MDLTLSINAPLNSWSQQVLFVYCPVSFSPSVIPLLKESVGVLMQRIPTGLENNLHIGYQRVSAKFGNKAGFLRFNIFYFLV